MQEIKYEIRNNCIISNDSELEVLSNNKCPIFCGCVEHDANEDLIADEEIAISKNYGVIQLCKLIPLDMLYKNGHDAGSVGSLWESHHLEFSNFIMDNQPKKVIEIGGAHGKLALNCLRKQNISWTIVEPNPTNKIPQINYIQDFFSKEILQDGDYDTIVHSHTFEHIYDPHRFLCDIKTAMGGGGKRMIFSLPNMEKWLKNKWTNCLGFEHSIFLTEDVISFLLASHGFEVIKKKYFLEHSIFYLVNINIKVTPHTLTSEYNTNKKLYTDMTTFYRNQISLLNYKLRSSKKDVYLFGAHLFSQYLLYHGLDSHGIKGILDNNVNKQGKRLYGTNFYVYTPHILKNKNKSLIILNAGAYNSEIKNDILHNINANVEIIEF